MNLSDYREQAKTRWREKTPGLGVSAESMRNRPLRVVGFGLFWAWIWLLFQNASHLVSADSSSLLLTLLYYLPTLFYALGFALIGALYRLRHLTPCGRRYEISLAAAVTAGTLFIAVGFELYSLYPEAGCTLCFAGCVFTGTGAAFVHTEWARLFVRLGARATIICCVFATFLAGTVVLMADFVPRVGIWIGMIATPGLSAHQLFADPLWRAPSKEMPNKAPIYMPWKLLVTAFVQGLSLGLIATLSTSFFTLPATAAIVGYILGAALIFSVVLLLRVDYNSFIYKIGFPIMAAAWLIILATGSVSLFSIGVHATGYRFIDLAIWSVTIYIIKEKHLPTNWVCAVNTSALMLGQFLGAGLALLPLVPTLRSWESAFLNGYAALMVFMLFMVALLVFSTKNLQTGWGLVRPSDEAAPDPLEEACRKLGSYRRLTKRETDILIYLARGRNRAFICDELVLAQDTVKTYIRTVYRKLEVHSQQELISIVEEQMRTLEE